MKKSSTQGEGSQEGRIRRQNGFGNVVLIVSCILFGLLAIFWDSIEGYMISWSGVESCPYLMKSKNHVGGERGFDVEDAHRFVAYRNGYVLTGSLGGDDGPPFVTEFVVDRKTGRFVAKANMPEMEAQIMHVDLDGALVTPGLVDPHLHFLSGGLALLQQSIDAGNVETKEDLEVMITKAAQGKTTTDWIVVYNFKGELMGREWLDSASGDVACVVFRFDFHQMLVNSRVLEIASITNNTEEPAGGSIRKDRTGNPTGVLCDTAMGIVTGLMPRPTKDDLLLALKKAQSYAFSKGCTHVHDMGRVSFVEGEFASFDDIQDVFIPAADSGILTIRVEAFVSLPAWEAMAAMVEALGRKRGTLRIGNVKGFYDGSLSSRTALMHHPYQDDPEDHRNYGMKSVGDISEWINMIQNADNSGLRIAIHAIGSRAIDDVLEVYENSTAHAQHRIEHAQHVSGLGTIDRMSKLGVSVTPNPLHWIHDRKIIPTRLHTKDAAYSYPLNEFDKKSIQIGLASDWPVVDLSPWDTLEAAIDPRNEHAMSFPKAFWSITRGAVLMGDAKADFGIIKDGMLADFVIHTTNPTKTNSTLYRTLEFPGVSASNLDTIKRLLATRSGVKQTFVSGSCMFGCSLP